MLQINRDTPGNQGSPVSPGEMTARDLVRMLIGLVRRHIPIFIVSIACCVAAGALYAYTTAPIYSATATMVIDAKKGPTFSKDRTDAETPLEADAVQTQVELLRSQNVSLAVINKLHLAQDPEFTEAKPGLIGRIVGLFKPRPPSPAGKPMDALGTFEGDRSVDRIALTYVMEVSFKSLNPDKAARIANAIVDAYIDDQLSAKYQATRRASDWLQDRVKELRAQSTTADAAVVDFRNSHNIISTGGKLMNEQQVGEVNTQLVLAEAATAEAKARLDRIREVLKQPVPDSSVSDALKNEVIIKLRQNYLDIAAKEAIWADKYGVNHGATVSLRTQMVELRKSISDEIHKIAQSYESDYNIAKAREDSIRSSLKTSVGQSMMTSQAEIELRSLESTSASYKSMYNILLQRYMEAMQQQSFPISEARLISPAVPPGRPSQPKKAAILASALIAGVLAAFAAAFAREMFDHVFRSGRQVAAQLGLTCIATVPSVKGSFSTPTPLVPPVAAGGNRDRLRRAGKASPILNYAVAKPFSQFAEALRSAKIAVDVATVGQACRVIGVTSTLPGEGKTTTAANLAQMIAQGGARVLLVDADLRNPSLTRSLASDDRQGLLDLLDGRCDVADHVRTDEVSGLHLLAAGGDVRPMHTNETLASDRIAAFFERLQGSYDYIILDCAPLGPVVDTRAMAQFVHHFLYVIQWGGTGIEVVQRTLEEAPEILERIVGVVLNKADMVALGRYEVHRGKAFHKRNYKRYGYVD